MLQFLLTIWLYIVAIYDSLRGRYAVIVVEELPDKVEDRKLYAVGESGQYWLAALRCPCGCGEVIQLPMMEGQRPRWTLIEQGKRLPSLSPSVDRTIGCRSHFWLRRGNIHWC